MRGVKTSRSAMGTLFSALLVAGMTAFGMAAGTVSAAPAKASCYQTEIDYGFCNEDYGRPDYDFVRGGNRDRCDWDRGCGRHDQWQRPPSPPGHWVWNDWAQLWDPPHPPPFHPDPWVQWRWDGWNWCIV